MTSCPADRSMRLTALRTSGSSSITSTFAIPDLRWETVDATRELQRGGAGPGRAEHRPDLGDARARRERLLPAGAAGLDRSLAHDGLVRVAGDEQHRNLRSDVVEVGRELAARHHRHHHV